jgi:cell wall assembly regulator SMI1
MSNTTEKTPLEIWSLIEQSLEKAGSPINRLNGPATPAQIEALERLIGAPLPDEFRKSLLLHNGGIARNEIFEGEELLSLERITEEWLVWRELFDSDPGFKSFRSSPPIEVKDNWWNPLWIPLTSNHAGDHWCLDLDPSPLGRRGQVIRMWHDMDMRELRSRSYLEFIASLLS